jgi:hypothetical protein
MKDMKTEFNKNIKILKKYQIEILEMKLKTQLKSSSIDWIKLKTTTGYEDRVDELEYSNKD